MPLYGAQGTIFAYPPLAIYLMGFWLRLVGHDPTQPGVVGSAVLQYFRFAPALFGLLFLVAVYFLVKQLFNSRLKAALSVVLVSSLVEVYSSHLTAAGVVRAPAYALVLAGLALFWSAAQAKPIRLWDLPTRHNLVLAGLAGLCFGATVLTHLSYVQFCVFSLLVFTLRLGLRRVFWPAIITGSITALLALPWIAWIARVYGWDTFLFASGTHGSLGLLRQYLDNPIQFPGAFVHHLLSLRGWLPVPLVGAGLLGMGYSVLRRGWLLPVWFLTIFIGMGESERYLAVIASLAVADLLGDFTQFSIVRSDPQFTAERALLQRPSITQVMIIVSVVSIFWLDGLAAIRSTGPALTPAALEAAGWVAQHTTPDMTFLYASGDHDLGEWLPYLTHRTALISHWGAEWLGTYQEQYALFLEMEACADRQSFECVEGLMQRNQLKPDLLLVRGYAVQLSQQILDQSAWRLVYENSELLVFKFASED